ncbi:urotensin-2 receptor-like [Lampetra planeri]
MMSSAGNRSAESGDDHHRSSSSHHLLLQGQQQMLALQQQLLLLALPSANSSSAHDFPATAAAASINGHHNRSHQQHQQHHHQQGDYDYDDADSRSAMAIAVVLSAMFVVGVAGNVYTLALVTRHASSTSSMYVYVLNLALADLLYVATAPFVACSNVARTWHFGDAGCRLLLSADLLTTHASAFILTAMSVERYAAVHRPLRSLERGRTARRLVALAAWLGALALALPGMVMVRMEEVAVVVSDRGAGGGDGSTRSVTKRVCEPTWSEEAHRVYMSALFATGILAPGVIIGCVYAKLARTYWRSQTAMGGFGRCKVDGRGRSPHSPRHKVLYLILAIVLAFWACFLPFWLWQLLQLYRPHVALASVRTARAVNHAVTCLTYGNSCVNPFLYTLLTNKYKEYLATGTRRRRWHRPRDGGCGAGGGGRVRGGSDSAGGGPWTRRDAALLPLRSASSSSRAETSPRTPGAHAHARHE